ncbi:hypothetical protein ScPMuIL_005807 [Solemya velum]
MKKEPKADVQRPYKLAHQTLCIRGINFETQSLLGYVELALHPLRPDLRRVKVNSKQCRVYRVCINEQWEAAFQYNDPTLEICQGDAKQRNLDYFQNCYMNAINSVDPDNANGEITVKLPSEAFPAVSELRPIRVCIEFSLEQPKGGIHFVNPEVEGTTAEKGQHLFTYGHENLSRLWFPCIDTYSEPCTWKLEFTVDLEMTAVSCGDLVEVVYTPNKKMKTFHYFLPIPTAAPNIALAVGPFEILVDPYMHEVTHFCLPHLSGILKHTSGYIHEAFEFYEELMSIRYPYSCYKQVFVDESYVEMASYATMTIYSTNLLHSSRVIDQTFVTRRLMATAVAQQFFGCFIAMQSWSDAWLTKGISGYLGSLFVKKTFGNNEYRHTVSTELRDVSDFESKVSGIALDPSGKDSSLPFTVRHPHTVSPRYSEIFSKKARIVIRMLEIRIGAELLIMVFNKLLTLAHSTAQQKFLSNSWSNMLLSTNSFKKIISTVTGKDIQHFLEQWVLQSGCARFLASFVFNRKRNVVELEIKQDLNAKGALKYVGPLTVTIQELDGSFNHNFKIEENKTKFEITCHSKSRRNKKKKIPLMTGEEVDMDLGAMDSDSPVLWLQIDTNMHLLRQVILEQPDYMWQYLLRYERDVVSQSEAIRALRSFPVPSTRMALTDILEKEHCFYKIRMEACMCLAKVANAMVENWSGPPAMMTIFRKMFGSHSCPSIIRQNNFSKFQHYFLLKTIPYAMAHLRDVHNICPVEVMKFLFDLFKYNDNSRNKYSDNYYRASLIESLAATVTPVVAIVTGQGPSSENLPGSTKLILEEVTRYLNLEKLLPCYRHTVTVSCLRAIQALQKFGHVPSCPDLFKSYAQPGVFRDVRLAALEALVDFTKTDVSNDTLFWLLDMVATDPDPYVRHSIIRMLVRNPPFRKTEENSLNTEELVERLWKLMNSILSHDSRLRCGASDLYFLLYGRTRPAVIPIPKGVVVLNLKEKRTMMNPSMVPKTIVFHKEGEGEKFQSSIESNINIEPVKKDREVEGAERRGVKRKAESPLADSESDIMKGETRTLTTGEESRSKVALPQSGQVNPEDQQSASSARPAQGQSTSFAMEFFRFTGARLEDTATSSSFGMDSILPPSIPRTESASRLSEDSGSSPLGPQNMLPDIKPIPVPTSFGGIFSSALPATEISTKTLPMEESSSKHHKAKKKKKKNKHKHKKHKRQHEQGERHEKDKHKHDLHRESQCSSGTSNVNSPIVPHHDPPSSPDFEVI